MIRHKPVLGAIFVGSLVLFIAILPLVIGFGLYHDDFLILEGLTLKSALTLEDNAMIRPVSYVLMYLSKALGDTNFFGHVLNGLIAYATVIIALTVVVHTLASYNADQTTLTWRQTCFVVLIFFSLALHYSTTWNFMWISGIQTLLWGFFTVLSIKYFQRLARVEGHGKKPYGIVALLLIFYSLGLLSYEACFSIPVVLLAVYIYDTGRSTILHPGRNVARLYAGYALVSTLYFAIPSRFAYPTPNPTAWVRRIYALVEFFLSIADPTNKPILTYLVDLRLPLAPGDIVPLGSTLLGSLVLFIVFVTNPGDSRNNEMRVKNSLFLALLILASAPIFLGRRAFAGRLAFGLIFPFAIALAYWARDSLQRNKIALLPAFCWMMLSMYSFTIFARQVSQISEFKERWHSVIMASTSYDPTGTNVLGLSFPSFFGYYAVSAPSLSYYYNVAPAYTGMVCDVFDRSFRPSDFSLDQIVNLDHVAENIWRYRVQNQRTRIRESHYVGTYSAGDVIQLSFGSVVVRKVNKRGYITEFEVMLGEGITLLDADLYR